MTVSPSVHEKDHSGGFPSIDPALYNESHVAKASSSYPWLLQFAGTCLPSEVMGLKLTCPTLFKCWAHSVREEGFFCLPGTLGFLCAHACSDQLHLCVSSNRQRLALGLHSSYTSDSRPWLFTQVFQCYWDRAMPSKTPAYQA